MTRVIPLTQPGPLWSQREYVACRKLGIGFAAHRHGETRQVFHYYFPAEANCCTSVIVHTEGVERYIDHNFVPGTDWIGQCSAAMRKES